MSRVELGLGQRMAVSTELSWKDSSEEGRMLPSASDSLDGGVLAKRVTADYSLGSNHRHVPW